MQTQQVVDVVEQFYAAFDAHSDAWKDLVTDRYVLHPLRSRRKRSTTILRAGDRGWSGLVNEPHAVHERDRLGTPGRACLVRTLVTCRAIVVGLITSERQPPGTAGPVDVVGQPPQLVFLLEFDVQV
jgi:hypothetical protein